MVTDPQNGRHTLARGHQIGVGDAQTHAAHGIQRRRHQRLHRQVPVSIPRRKPPGQIPSLACRPLTQFGFGGVCGLFGQCTAQCIGGHTGGNVADAGPANLCIRPGSQRHRQQNGLRTAVQVPHHIPAPQDACVGQGRDIRLQPDRPGRGSGQQRCGTAFQQGHGGLIRRAPCAKIPRRLRKIDLLRLFHR